MHPARSFPSRTPVRPFERANPPHFSTPTCQRVAFRSLATASTNGQRQSISWIGRSLQTLKSESIEQLLRTPNLSHMATRAPFARFSTSKTEDRTKSENTTASTPKESTNIEVENTKALIKNFNEKPNNPILYMKLLEEFHEVKFQGGWSQRQNSSPTPGIACLRLVEFLKCKKENIQLLALDYLTAFLKTPFERYVTNERLVLLERSLGTCLVKLSIIRTPKAILEQIVTVYKLLIEKLVICTLEGNVEVDLKYDISIRIKAARSLLRTPSYQYQITTAFNLAEQLHIDKSLEQFKKVFNEYGNNIGSLYQDNPVFFDDLTESILKRRIPDIRISEIKKENLEKFLKNLNSFISFLNVSNIFRKKISLITPQHKNNWFMEILLLKYAWSKIPRTERDIENFTKKLKATYENNIKNSGQHLNSNLPLLYGAIEIFEEIALAANSTESVKKVALNSLIDLTTLPDLPDQVYLKIMETLLLLQEDDLPLEKVSIGLKYFDNNKPLIANELIAIKQAKEELYSQIDIAIPDNFSPIDSYYINRKKLINKISDFFRTKNYEKHTAIQIITGLSGYGMSQLAIKYARTYFFDYQFDKNHKPYVYYLNCKKLDIINKTTPEERDVEIYSESKLIEFNKQRETNKGWLLVIDNMNIPNSLFLKKYIPKKGGHVIITSSDSDRLHWINALSEEGEDSSNVSSRVSFLELPSFTPQESLELLEKIILLNKFEKDSPIGLAELAKKVGHSPRALKAAADFINQVGTITIKDYLEMDWIRDYSVESNTLRFIRRNYELQFEEIFNSECKNFNSTARDLFILCLYLECNAISLNILNAFLKKKNIKTSIHIALNRLKRFSFFSYNIEKKIIHINSLVQEYARSYLENQSNRLSLNINDILTLAFEILLSNDDGFGKYKSNSELSKLFEHLKKSVKSKQETKNSLLKKTIELDLMFNCALQLIELTKKIKELEPKRKELEQLLNNYTKHWKTNLNEK